MKKSQLVMEFKLSSVKLLMLHGFYPTKWKFHGVQYNILLPNYVKFCSLLFFLNSPLCVSISLLLCVPWLMLCPASLTPNLYEKTETEMSVRWLRVQLCCWHGANTFSDSGQLT
jgi:hypothetical protein